MVEEREIDGTGSANDRGIFGTNIETGPEASIFDTNQAEVLSDAQRPETVDEDGADVLKEVEAERSAATTTKRGKRLVLALLMLLVVLVTAGLCFWFVAGAGATKKARVPVNKTGAATDTDEATTRQAIQQLNGGGPVVSFGDGTVARPQVSPGASPNEAGVTSVQPVTELPGQTTGSLMQTAASEKSNTAVSSSATDSASRDAATVMVSGRNEEKSIRIGEEVASTVAPRRDESRKADDRAVESKATVAVPSFGSMLPVRSLGVIYSLRSGALARFELTRDVNGRGWSLHHGTVMVGAVRGAEYNRAYIALIGFIDPDSGKFVQVGGDLLGADGGAGVKGKRRQMTSTWSKVFRRLGEAGLNLAERAAASISQGPIIITDAYGSTATRVGNEFNGVLTNKDRDSFIEIAAWTSCYVMITDLPERLQGVSAVATWSNSDLEQKTDADGRRAATGLSERELAELLQSGDVGQIRAALPRMTAEMRRVAEAVIAEGGN